MSNAVSQGRQPAVARSLTPGEIGLAQSIFGTALNTATVLIHNRPYFAGQGKQVAMTPNGEIWFRPEDYKPDFSHTIGDASWLIHELTHAWQFQTGRSVRFRGFFEQVGRLFGADPYHYGALDPATPFASYKNEQQAAIVEDYFRVTRKIAPRRGSGNLEDYRAVIPFLPKLARK